MGEGEEGTEFVISLSRQAHRFLEKINQSDKTIAKRISQLVDALQHDPYSYKSLKGEAKGLKVARVGDYRIIYKIRGNEIFVVNIGHRRDVYRG